MTTDLVEKATLQSFEIDGKPCHIGGIGKGSGMIAPSMATMLIFFTTDVAIAPAVLHEALARANAASFNRISVDSDTSTSDTIYVLASGAAGNPRIERRQVDKTYDAFTGSADRRLAETWPSKSSSMAKARRGRSRYMLKGSGVF